MHACQSTPLSKCLVCAQHILTGCHFTVPGDPQDVKAVPINSTTIKVTWKPPLAKDRNGIIRGYHIHVQETKEEVIIHSRTS